MNYIATVTVIMPGETHADALCTINSALRSAGAVDLGYARAGKRRCFPRVVTNAAVAELGHLKALAGMEEKAAVENDPTPAGSDYEKYFDALGW